MEACDEPRVAAVTAISRMRSARSPLRLLQSRAKNAAATSPTSPAATQGVAWGMGLQEWDYSLHALFHIILEKLV